MLQADYTGNGKTDYAIFDPVQSEFFVVESTGARIAQQLGDPTHHDIPLVVDYTGDGKDDFAVFDPVLSEFFVVESNGNRIAQPFGNPAHHNIPLVGDYLGTGHDQFVIYDTVASKFYALDPNGTTAAQALGNNTHQNVPLVADYLGNGHDQFAIYDPVTSIFSAIDVSGAAVFQQLGNNTHQNVPLVADYLGHGHDQFAIYDPVGSEFYAIDTGGANLAQQLGNNTHQNVPLVADYLGNGHDQFAIYDPVTSSFYAIDTGGANLDLPLGNNTHGNLPLSQSGDHPGGSGAPAADQSTRLVGDFFNNGYDSAVLYDPVTGAFLRFQQISGGGLTGNPPVYGFAAFETGAPAADHPIPLVGDFFNNGYDSAVLYDPVTGAFLRFQQISGGGLTGNPPVYGFAAFETGAPAADHPIPLVGDFFNNGYDSAVLYDPVTGAFLRFQQISGGGLTGNPPVYGFAAFETGAPAADQLII